MPIEDIEVKPLEWEELETKALRAEPDEICEVIMYLIIPSASGDGWCNLTYIKLGSRGLGEYIDSFDSIKKAKAAAQAHRKHIKTGG
jgi:hypothetical protein